MDAIDVRTAIVRTAWTALGWICLSLGLIGAALPVLPTTIFIILAAGCFARGSPRLEGWLLAHPKFGPSLTAWRKDGAIAPRAKFLAVAMIALSFVATAVFAPLPPVWLWLLGAVLFGVACFIISRPNPR